MAGAGSSQAKLFWERNALLIIASLLTIAALIYFLGHQLARFVITYRILETKLAIFPLSWLIGGDQNALIQDLQQTTGFIDGITDWFCTALYNTNLALQQYQSLLDNHYRFSFWQGTKFYFYYIWWTIPYLFLAHWFLIRKPYLKKSEADLFTKQFNMDTLIEREQTLYPELLAAKKMDLLKSSQNLDTNWSFTLSETEFAQKYDLFLKGKENQFIDAFGHVHQKLNYYKAKEVFSLQLDKRFYGFNSLAPHRKAVFALLGMMWFINDSTKKDDEDETELVNNYKNEYTIKYGRMIAEQVIHNNNEFKPEYIDDKFLNYCYEQFSQLDRYKTYVEGRHAYELTTFATLIQGGYAFQGVLSTSLMTWLKQNDRLLFVTLNCVGRQKAYFAEVAGIMAHWQIEKDTGLPLIEKKVNEAILGLERELLEFRQEEIGQEDLI